MQGYDLDDTLAKVEYDLAGVRGLANVFASAKVIYQPEEPFIVITARPHGTSALKTATENWLQDNQPNYKGTYYVSGSEAEIIRGKIRLITDKNLTDFTDNNTDILAELKKELTNVRLWKMTAGGRRSRY